MDYFQDSKELSAGVGHNLELALDSLLFKVLAGPQEQRFMVHEDILHQSPVLRAMTRLPFKEKKERILRFPEADPAHVDCLLRFFYSGVFVSREERLYLRNKEIAEEALLEEAWNLIDEKLKDDDVLESDEHITLDEGVEDNSVEMSAGTNSSSTTHDSTTPNTYIGEYWWDMDPQVLHLIEDLAKMYVFGDMFLVRNFQACVLRKLKVYLNPYTYPMEYLKIATYLKSSVPECDSQLALWLEEDLPTAASQVVNRGEEGQQLLDKYVAMYGPIDYTSEDPWGSAFTNGLR